MTGHMPWRWIVDHVGEKKEAFICLKAGSAYILSARCSHENENWIAVSKEHAHLIAAAPELLTALKLVRSMVGAPHDFTIADIWNAQKKADEVIAKAEAAKVTG